MFADFQVYGYVEGAPLFDQANTGVKVTKSGNAWTYDGTKYWIKDANYNFNAVAPATNGNWTKENATATQTTLSFENNGTTDLLYATATAVGQESGENDPVAFTFRHTLSKVKFSFKNAYNASNSSICVRGIQITNADATAVATLTAGTAWSDYNGEEAIAFGNATTVEDYSVEDDVNNSNKYDFEFERIVESYFERFVIPAQKDWNITFIVDLLVNGQVIKTYGHEIVLTNAKFEPGKSYDLLAEIDHTNIDPATSQDAIEFTVTEITDWDNDHDGKENTPAGDTDGDNQVDTELN